MLHRSWFRAALVASVLGAPLAAGDYDHLFDVARDAWPERNVAMAICDKDANQFALIDLADAAKARGISLLIVDLRAEKDYARTLAAAMSRKPGFVLLIDDDALLGTGPNCHLTVRMVYRAIDSGCPVVGISPAAFKLGAVMTVGSAPGDPVQIRKELARKLNLTVPDGAVDPTEGKGKTK